MYSNNKKIYLLNLKDKSGKIISKRINSFF